MNNNFIESLLNYRYKTNLYIDLLKENQYFNIENNDLRKQILKETINQTNLICEGKEEYPEHLKVKKQLNEGGVSQAIKFIFGGGRAGEAAAKAAEAASKAGKSAETGKISPRPDIVVQPPKKGKDIEVAPEKPTESDVQVQLGVSRATSTTPPSQVQPTIGTEELRRITAGQAMDHMARAYAERALKFSREGKKGDELHKAILDDLKQSDPLFKSTDPEMQKAAEALTKDPNLLGYIRTEAEGVGTGGEEAFVRSYEPKSVPMSASDTTAKFSGKNLGFELEARIGDRVKELDRLRKEQQHLEPLRRTLESRGMLEELEQLVAKLQANTKRQEELAKEIGRLGIEREYSKIKEVPAEVAPSKEPPSRSTGSEVTPKVDEIKTGEVVRNPETGALETKTISADEVTPFPEKPIGAGEVVRNPETGALETKTISADEVTPFPEKPIGAGEVVRNPETGALETKPLDPAPKPVKEPTPAPKPVKEPAPAPEKAKEPAPSPEKAKEPAPAPEKAKEPAPSPEKAKEPAPAPEKAKEPIPEKAPAKEVSKTPNPKDETTPKPKKEKIPPSKEKEPPPPAKGKEPPPPGKEPPPPNKGSIGGGFPFLTFGDGESVEEVGKAYKIDQNLAWDALGGARLSKFLRQT